MQAETSFAVTLKSRPLFPFPQAAALGAAFVAASVLVATQYHHHRQAEPDAPEAQATATLSKPAADPWGALIHIAPEPQAVARTPLSESPWIIGIEQQAKPETETAEREPEREILPEREAPLPPRRPQSFANAQREAAPAVETPAPDNRGFLERLFNIQPSDRTALAYAAPQDGVVGNALRNSSQALMGYADKLTAVYDISAKTVTMPNGEKLEAHSGLGPLLDDPNRVHVKNRGATPPNVYDLTLREQLFHGVRALRLNPVNSGDMFGRDGMLAHTYMLGPNGDSNGCVSFKDYDRFLRAYLNGEVKRLIVVQRVV